MQSLPIVEGGMKYVQSLALSLICCVFVTTLAEGQNLGSAQSIPIPQLGGVIGYSVDQVGNNINLTINGAVINETRQVPAPLGGPAWCGDFTNRYPAPSLTVGVPVATIYVRGCALRYCSIPGNTGNGTQGMNADLFLKYDDPILKDHIIMQFLNHGQQFWTNLKC